MGNQVKHLLIIISFLLLSSPVIGDNHKGETLYRWNNFPPYKWMGHGDNDTHPKYLGQVQDGKPNGLGILIEPNGSKYVGEYKDNKRWNGTEYDKKGNILGKYVEGSWIKQ